MAIDASILSRIRGNDPTLVSFNIGNSDFNDNDIIMLADALRDNTYLTRIIIQGDYHCNYSSRVLAHDLINDGSPAPLPPKPNRWMTDRGAIALAACPHIIYLDLSHNPIADEGAKALARHVGLRELKLNQCHVDVVGAVAFLHNQSLGELWMIGNPAFNSTSSDKGLALLTLTPTDKKGLEFSELWNKQIKRRLRDNKIQSKPALAQQYQAEELKKRLEKELMHAIDVEDVSEIHRVLALMPDGANTYLVYGCSPLLYAVDENKLISARTLLEAGARIETHGREYTPLFRAAEDGKDKLVQLFLQFGANMTGEFYFNGEQALTIATFKFLEILTGTLRAYDFSYFKIASQRNMLEGNHQAISSFLNLDISHWIALGNDMTLCRDLAIKGLTLLNQLKKQPELCSEKLVRYANIVKWLENKTRVIKDAPQAPSSSQSSSAPSMIDESAYDEAFSIQSEYCISRPTTRLPTTDILNPRVIEQLNTQLAIKKIDEIDWTAMPLLFIAQYRCIHFYTHAFSATERADHLRTNHLNRLAAAPAAYQMTGLHPKQHQLARETELEKHRKTIAETFELLYATSHVQVYGRSFLNASDAMQERMSSRYADFQTDVREGKNPYAAQLKAKGIIGYPHYATSDLPRHPLRYGYGVKRVIGLLQGTLLPCYDECGKPRVAHLGKIYISLFSPLALANHKARHIPFMDRGFPKRTHIRNYKGEDTIVPEREASIPGGVDAEYMFYEAVLEVPDFSVPYSKEIHEYRFGIDMAQYKLFKRDIIQAVQKGQQPDLRNLFNVICDHKEKQLMRLAEAEARAQGGYLIYCHDEKQYGLKPFLPNQTEERLFAALAKTSTQMTNSSVNTSMMSSPYSTSTSHMSQAIAKRQCTPSSYEAGSDAQSNVSLVLPLLPTAGENGLSFSSTPMPHTSNHPLRAPAAKACQGTDTYAMFKGIFVEKKKTTESSTKDILLSRYKTDNLAQALRKAAYGGHIDDVTSLIDYGAVVNARDNNPKSGKTALHHAIIQGHDAVAALLKQHGADDSLVDADGKTAQDYFRERTVLPHL